ncbi:MAG: BamA/TamA family outer membrane protein [Neisseriaceae bacterium]
MASERLYFFLVSIGFSLLSVRLEALPLADQNIGLKEQAKQARYQVYFHFYPLTAQKLDAREISHLRELFDQHLSIMKFRVGEELDREQQAYLVLDTPEEIGQILNTEGYFSSQVAIKSKDELGQPSYDIQIGLPAPVRVKNKVVVLSGAIEKDPSLQQYYQTINRSWRLGVAQIFKQELWNDSKQSALRAIQRERYPLANIKDSYAQIDAHKHQALLQLEIDSGPPIRFGEIKISGVQRYPEHLAKDLAGFKTGDFFSASALTDYQERLEKDGHYREVDVDPQLDQIQAGYVPVMVQLKEQLKNSLSLELTYDSEDGPGSILKYQYYNFLRRGYLAELMASYNKYEQEADLEITQPRDASGHFLTGKTGYFRGIRNGLDTRLWTTGMWYVHSRKSSEQRLGLEYYEEKLKPRRNLSDWKANNILLLTGAWTLNRISTPLRPENGYYLSAKVGSTMGTLASSVAMQRYELDMDYYLTPWARKYGTFLLKLQLGYVHANGASEVPDELKFKIGGTGSVRGYATESIGKYKDGYIFGGKTKLAGTIEYQKPISKDFSLAFFHDFGDVEDHFKNIRLKHSTGVGLRWYSILAPFAFDVAYAHQRNKLGWHINLGTRF